MDSTTGIFAITALVVVSSIGLMLLVRRLVGHEILERHNDVAGFIYAVVGVMYAVLLAFVVIVVWELHRDAENKVQEEVRHMASLFRNVQVFGDPHRAVIQAKLIEYAQVVVDDEWPGMGSRYEESDKARQALAQAFVAFKDIEPKTDREGVWYQEVVQHLNQFVDARNQRLLAAREAVPRMMWAILIAGGVVTIGFSLLFSTANGWAQAVMVGSLSAIVALVLLLILALEHPFSGGISVSPDAFEEQLRHFKSWVAHAPLPVAK